MSLTIRDYPLDYSVESAVDRTAYVSKMLQGKEGEFYDYYSENYNPHITNSQPTSGALTPSKTLEALANYILYAKDNPKHSVEIKPKNDSFTSKKKVVSLEAVMENEGEASLQPMEKTGYSNPKPRITQEDIERIPGLKELREGIEHLVAVNQYPKGSLMHYKVRHLLIGIRKEQYAIKDMFARTVAFNHITKGSTGQFDYDNDTYVTLANGAKKLISKNALDFRDPNHIYQILRHYSALRQHIYDNLNSNIRYVLDSLEEVIDHTDLSDARRWILIRKIDGADNSDIQHELREKYGLNYQSNYISVIYKQEICEKIAFTAGLEEDKFIHRQDPSKWKVCSWCGERKLRDEREFVKKKTTFDGLSNRCKCCDKLVRDSKKEGN